MKCYFAGEGALDLFCVVFVGHEKLCDAEFARGRPRWFDKCLDQGRESLGTLGDTLTAAVGKPVLDFLTTSSIDEGNSK